MRVLKGKFLMNILPPWLVDVHLLSLCHVDFPLCSHVSYSPKDSSHIGLGPTPMNSINLKYFVKDKKIQIQAGSRVLRFTKSCYSSDTIQPTMSIYTTEIGAQQWDC